MRAPGAKPWVVVNMAMSADGKIATSNRQVETFGSKRDYVELLRVRSGVDVVLCGARTAGGVGISMNSGGPEWVRRRLAKGLRAEPMRVIVSGRGGISPCAPVFSAVGGPCVVVVSERAPVTRLVGLRKVVDELLVLGRDRVDLRALLTWLRVAHAVRRVVCEGGGDLNDAMFRAGLVDEVRLTICPVVVAGREAPTIADGVGVDWLASAARLELRSRRRVGDELFLAYRVVRSGSER